LIAEVMLQRTKAEQVLPVYKAFVKEFPNAKIAARGNSDRIRILLRSLGLRWRVEKILELTNELASKDGKIPCSQEELVKLPGIGLYIANAFLCFHEATRAPVIDRNAVRLWGRVFGFQTDSETHRRKQFIKLVTLLTPSKYFRQFNYAVLDLSRAICKRKPLCSSCPLLTLCAYPRNILTPRVNGNKEGYR